MCQQQHLYQQYLYLQNQQLLLFLIDDDDEFIDYPVSWQVQAQCTKIGLGRGKVLRQKRRTFDHFDLYNYWSTEHQDKFLKLLHITFEEFNLILQELENLKPDETSLSMSFANKLLLCLHYVIQYIGSNNLATLFNTSEFYVSKVLDEILPILVEYFVKFIPNKKIHNTRSRLHPRMKFIIYGTLHKTQRQHGVRDVHYNGHYRMHGRLTQILLDYEGYVVAFNTNIKGKIHDSLAAMYNKDFKRIVGNDIVLGDPGFSGVDYVISGFKPCTLSKWEEHIFDSISRREQVLIENANNYIKEAKSVNKLDTFRHGEHRLLACVFIAIGLYNLKRTWGYFQ